MYLLFIVVLLYLCCIPRFEGFMAPCLTKMAPRKSKCGPCCAPPGNQCLTKWKSKWWNPSLKKPSDMDFGLN